MNIGQLLLLAVFLGPPVLILLVAIRRAPRGREYGRLGERACAGLGAASALALMAAWLAPGLSAGRDPHQWEVAGMAVTGALACAVLTWFARHPRAGGLSVALGGLVAATVAFWAGGGGVGLDGSVGGRNGHRHRVRGPRAGAGGADHRRSAGTGCRVGKIG
ncbi:hypothetical protein [Corynebacterium halotolerans]|nr:hypothetical protein [Corynebacterium halotolerans]